MTKPLNPCSCPAAAGDFDPPSTGRPHPTMCRARFVSRLTLVAVFRGRIDRPGRSPARQVWPPQAWPVPVLAPTDRTRARTSGDGNSPTAWRTSPRTCGAFLRKKSRVPRKSTETQTPPRSRPRLSDRHEGSWTYVASPMLTLQPLSGRNAVDGPHIRPEKGHEGQNTFKLNLKERGPPRDTTEEDNHAARSAQFVPHQRDGNGQRHTRGGRAGRPIRQRPGPYAGHSIDRVGSV